MNWNDNDSTTIIDRKTLFGVRARVSFCIVIRLKIAKARRQPKYLSLGSLASCLNDSTTIIDRKTLFGVHARVSYLYIYIERKGSN